MKSLFLTLLVSLLVSATLDSCAQKTKAPVKKDAHLPAKALSKYSQATFAAGCFWHEEALFESIKGVKEAVSGYAGGSTNNPTYESIETGKTGHAETVNVYYDPAVIAYPELLKVYFSAQDPTQVNGQGPDHGTQYRSIVFYRTNQEKQLIQNYIKNLQNSGKYSDPIAAQVVQFSKFWEAERYHQNYIEHNPGTRYVQLVSIPEIKKLQKQYPQLVKPGYEY
jgi:peptide-methionine (S)-S-oxide reductase